MGITEKWRISYFVSLFNEQQEDFPVVYSELKSSTQKGTTVQTRSEHVQASAMDSYHYFSEEIEDFY